MYGSASYKYRDKAKRPKVKTKQKVVQKPYFSLLNQNMPQFLEWNSGRKADYFNYNDTTLLPNKYL